MTKPHSVSPTKRTARGCVRVVHAHDGVLYDDVQEVAEGTTPELKVSISSSFVRSFVLIHSFSFIRSFIHSFVHSFIQEASPSESRYDDPGVVRPSVRPSVRRTPHSFWFSTFSTESLTFGGSLIGVL